VGIPIRTTSHTHAVVAIGSFIERVGLASAADFVTTNVSRKFKPFGTNSERLLNLLRILLAVFVADKASQTLSVKIRVTRLTSMYYMHMLPVRYPINSRDAVLTLPHGWPHKVVINNCKLS
jgi:hypothetical protein